ncbi:hypothetical protein MFIFM68171_03012 [Madurella fahalii]|uniref:Uncharacterized protein n=1 Tax=Madurella fahalii TaxID=1157608 RepID=A0ABQ0G4V6_9PEZI
MEFEFVSNNTAIDGASRKRIRSRAARGRNVGKTLTRRSRTNAPSTGQIFRASNSLESTGNEARETSASSSWIQQRACESLSIISLGFFPPSWPRYMGATNYLYRAVSFLSGLRYIRGLENALDYSTEPPSRWIQPMFSDEAYYHGAMAVSITVLNKLCTHPEAPGAAVSHLCDTFRLVNSRLSGPDAVSDENLAAVVILEMYERCRGQYREGLVHLNGLQRMTELRGGIFKLATSRPDVVQKILRSDLEHALYLDTPTRFRAADIAALLRNNSIPTIPRRLGQARPHRTPPPPLPSLAPYLASVLSDATQLSQLLHDTATSKPPRPRVNCCDLHGTLFILGYRLVQARSLPCPSATDRVVYAALAAFLLSFSVGSMGNWSLPPHLVAMARLEARQTGDEPAAEGEMLLWMVFVCMATGVFDAEDEVWLVPRTVEILGALGLDVASGVGGWEGVAQRLEQFPWIDEMHGKKGRAYWNRVVNLAGC